MVNRINTRIDSFYEAVSRKINQESISSKTKNKIYKIAQKIIFIVNTNDDIDFGLSKVTKRNASHSMGQNPSGIIDGITSIRQLIPVARSDELKNILIELESKSVFLLKHYSERMENCQDVLAHSYFTQLICGSNKNENEVQGSLEKNSEYKKQGVVVPQYVINCFSHMVNNGIAWKNLSNCNAYKSLNDLLMKNINTLNEDCHPVAVEEKDFIEYFCNQNFYLVHHTQSKLTDEQGAVELLSRKQLLVQDVKFDLHNTTNADLKNFSTDDFVFFSVEVENAKQKKSSRFGKFAYRVELINISPKIREFSLMQATDLQHFDRRPVMYLPEWVRNDDRKTFFTGNVNKRTIQELVFSGKDMITSLAMLIVRDLREFSLETRLNVLANRDNDKLNTIIHTLLNPQILFPHSIKLEHSSNGAFANGN